MALRDTLLNDRPRRAPATGDRADWLAAQVVLREQVATGWAQLRDCHRQLAQGHALLAEAQARLLRAGDVGGDG